MSENRPFLDFKAIKARASISSVLDRYGVKLNQVNQTTLKGNCPLPSHLSNSKNTFYASEAKSAWYCHSDSCKKNGRRAGGNVIDFVAAMESIPIYAAAVRIDEMFPATENPTMSNPAPRTECRPCAQIVGVSASPSEASTGTGNKPLGFALKDVNPAHPLIQERGISVETARLFGVGFFPGKGTMAGRIVFPLYDNNELVGYAGRTTLPISDTNAKWLIGKGLKKTFLYGLERCDPEKPLILVESFWGPPFFHEKGLQAASLMGSDLTESQERCLEPFLVITVALDDDPPGIKKAARICERLKVRHRIFKARLVE